MVENSANTLQEKWQPFDYFLGDWRGKGTGKPGYSDVERTYRLILDDQFIELKGRSLFEPQESNPNGEDHREIGLLSFDRNRSLYVLREFHVEGYVNQYVLEEPEPGVTKFVFITEAIENIAAGWSARTTYEILSSDSFRETFDLAGPEKEWSCYITNVFHKVS